MSTEWVRLIPSTPKRPTPQRYMLSAPAGGHKFEANNIYEVSPEIAKRLVRPDLLDNDPNGYPIFEKFATKQDALKKIAQENGVLPTMMEEPGVDLSDNTPLDPRGIKAVSTPKVKAGAQVVTSKAPSRPSGERGSRSPRT